MSTLQEALADAGLAPRRASGVGEVNHLKPRPTHSAIPDLPASGTMGTVQHRNRYATNPVNYDKYTHGPASFGTHARGPMPKGSFGRNRVGPAPARKPPAMLDPDVTARIAPRVEKRLRQELQDTPTQILARALELVALPPTGVCTTCHVVVPVGWATCPDCG